MKGMKITIYVRGVAWERIKKLKNRSRFINTLITRHYKNKEEARL